MGRVPILAVGLAFLVGMAEIAKSEAQVAQDQNWPVSVWVSSPTGEVRPGSEVWVDVTVTNISHEVILGPDYQLHAWDSEGRPAPLTKEEQERLKQGPTPLSRNYAPLLGPGRGYDSDADLSKVYDLTRPGTYTIQATAFYGHELIKSNTITILVTEAAHAMVPAEAEGESFSLVISTPRYTQRAGSEFDLKVRLENRSDHLTVVDNAETRYDIQAFDSQGRSAPLTDAGRTFRNYLGSGHATLVHLKPGEILRENFNDIAKLYDLSRPGAYGIQVSRFDDETKTWVKSNTITLTVTP